MYVQDKRDNSVFEVYQIRPESKSGYPHFLIYKNGQWLWQSAKHFKPF